MAYHNLKNARLNLVTRLRTLNDLNHEDVKVTQDYDFGIPEINQYGKFKSKYLKPFSTKLDEKRYSQANLKKLQTYYCFDMKTKISKSPISFAYKSPVVYRCILLLFLRKQTTSRHDVI